MIQKVLVIGRWVVDFLFAEEDYDIPGVIACLWDAYAPLYISEQAEDLMKSCEYNCGFTYANPYHKRAVVLIGPTTSGAEFLDTLTHEVHHLAVAIAQGLGIDLESEGPAYLSGDTARALAEVVCRMGCSHCRE